MKKHIMFIIVLVLFSSYSLAVGIQSTPFELIVFKPNAEYTFNFGLMGATKIGAFVDGDLGQYATVIDAAPDSGPRLVSAKLILPDTLEPGFHTLYLGAREIADIQGTMGGLAIAKVRVNVLSLYPGKYPQFSVGIKDINVGESGKAIVSVNNYGTETIDSAQGIIEIYGPDGESITSLYTNIASVASSQNVGLEASLDTAKFNLKPGKYSATARLVYDGITHEDVKELNFTIGSLRVDITSTTPEAIVNATNKYVINVESDWTGEINDVYARIITPNKKTLKTPNIDLVKPNRNNAKATGVLETYWETQGLDFGEYDMDIIIYYGKYTNEQTVKVRIVDGQKPVIEKPEAFQIIGLDDNKLVLFNTPLPMTLLLMVLLAIIVMFNVYYFIFRKSKNGGSPQNQQHQQHQQGPANILQQNNINTNTANARNAQQNTTSGLQPAQQGQQEQQRQQGYIKPPR
jgi:hypothetical protein